MAALRRRLAPRRVRRSAHFGSADAASRTARSRTARQAEFSKQAGRQVMSANQADAQLQLQTVSKQFGGIRALTEVSITVRRGRIVGVIGPNGSGKTTLFNVITSAYRADAGAIIFNERPVTHWPSHRIVRAGIAR